MSLNVGTQLGPYKITGLLGEGGMGIVFRAQDTKLQRDVALKLLPDHFADDPDRLLRFQREAQVLASLNHPNVAQIYGLEESGNRPCIVMELVEGETLQERLQRAPIPLDDALPIAKQILDALEAAHERGIIHRDLKPGNVKIAPGGRVKVLDFGLAKVFQEPQDTSLSNSPTMMNASVPGVIMGTAAYMSPEQTKGKDVDRASDIWAFGCVFFEMITGRAVFEGDSLGEILGAIFRAEPDWNRLPAETPEAIRRLLRLCLRKDQNRRLQSAHDARIEIEDALTAAPPASPAAPSARAAWTGRYSLVLLALLLISVSISAVLWFRVPTASSPVWSGTLLGGPPISYGPRISPDGRTIAFQALIEGQSQVAVLNPKSGNWTLLTHEKNAGITDAISWSQDGTKIYFSREDGAPIGIFSVPALGGEERLVLEKAAYPEELLDGSIIVTRINANRVPQLHRFRPKTGEIQPLNALASGQTASVPMATFRVFPDSRHVVFFGTPSDPSSAGSPPRLYVLDLNTNQARAVGPGPNELSAIFGLAVSAKDGDVLVNIRNGDLHEILAIPSDGKGAPHVLLTLTEESGWVDMAADGSLYLDQIARPMQTLRFAESAQQPETMAVVPVGTPESSSALELPDNRFLMTALFDGRSRLVAARPNGELVPFVDTEEETRSPLALAGPGRVAFILGKAPEESIAIASIKDGRILQRIKMHTTDTIRSFTASSDGETLFYSDTGSIWSIATSGGVAHKIGAGDAVAFDAGQQNLVVQVNAADGGARLVRMPITGGAVEPIPMHGDVGIPTVTWLGSGAVRADGKIIVSVVSRDSWFAGSGILDLKSGDLHRIPLHYDGDIFSPSWNQKGEIVTGGFLMRSSIWRFRPQVGVK